MVSAIVLPTPSALEPVALSTEVKAAHPLCVELTYAIGVDAVNEIALMRMSSIACLFQALGAKSMLQLIHDVELTD